MRYPKKHCPRLLNIHKTYNNRWEHSYQARNKDPGKIKDITLSRKSLVSTPGLTPGIKNHFFQIIRHFISRNGNCGIKECKNND
jgi:hypothetical protein